VNLCEGLYGELVSENIIRQVCGSHMKKIIVVGFTVSVVMVAAVFLSHDSSKIFILENGVSTILDVNETTD
jgi:hypothetical protein